MGLLADTENCGLRMRWECRERFPHHRGWAIPTCITTRVWRTCRDACRDGSLTSRFLWSRWWGKCSRHARRMRNPQFCVSGKRPMPVSRPIVNCHQSHPNASMKKSSKLTNFYWWNVPQIYRLQFAAALFSGDKLKTVSPTKTPWAVLLFPFDTLFWCVTQFLTTLWHFPLINYIIELRVDESIARD